MSTPRGMTREIGTALAVLAIYLLTILAPLHNARASQLGFEELGFSTLESSWVLCMPFGPEGADPDDTPAKCPATGIGKTDLAPPAFSTIWPAYDKAATAVPLPEAPALLRPGRNLPSGPRGPPVLV